MRYGIGFGVVAAALGTSAYGHSPSSPERVAALGAMFVPVVSYAGWLIASRRRVRGLLDEEHLVGGEAEDDIDVAERVRTMLAAFDAERAEGDAVDPFRPIQPQAPDVVDCADTFRRAIRQPHADVVDEHWRTLRPARGSTRPA